jgi:hypothetical protein
MRRFSDRVLNVLLWLAVMFVLLNGSGAKP